MLPLFKSHYSVGKSILTVAAPTKVQKPLKGALDCVSKIIVFAKNSKGCTLLNRIYSSAFTEGGGRIDFARLKSLYNPKDLKIAIPFYDSFLFHNLFSYKEPCILDDSFFDPLYLLEDNALPLDIPLSKAVKSYCGNDYEIASSKTIYYENREDFEAYQTYKCVCGRGFSSKAKTLDMPNLDHCGSPEFCFESYLDNEGS